uniref:HMG box domain-containing protein n=1 Tax=Periophthalmus magnuspinnatus TaxID=409849 RepID=A0A3B4AP18_9GOBI
MLANQSSPRVPCSPTLKPIALLVQETQQRTQSFEHQWSRNVPLTNTAVSQAVNQPYVSAPGTHTSTAPPHMMNGNQMYVYSQPCLHFVYSVCRKQHVSNASASKPYTRKPLNAFMLYRAEQRQRIMEELKITDSAAVSKALGELWRSLSVGEQAPYFDQALRLRKEHQARDPDWSPADNFAESTYVIPGPRGYRQCETKPLSI